MASRPFLPVEILATLTGIRVGVTAQTHTSYREHKIATKTRKARERRERRRRAEKRNDGNQFRYGVNWA